MKAGAPLRKALSVLYFSNLHTAICVALLYLAAYAPELISSFSLPYSLFLVLIVIAVYSADHLMDHRMPGKYYLLILIPAAGAAALLLQCGKQELITALISSVFGIIYYLFIIYSNKKEKYKLCKSKSILKSPLIALSAGTATAMPALLNSGNPVIGTLCVCVCLLNADIFELADYREDRRNQHPNFYNIPFVSQYPGLRFASVFIIFIAFSVMYGKSNTAASVAGWLSAGILLLTVYSALWKQRNNITEKRKRTLRVLADLALAIPAIPAIGHLIR